MSENKKITITFENNIGMLLFLFSLTFLIYGIITFIVKLISKLI